MKENGEGERNGVKAEARMKGEDENSVRHQLTMKTQHRLRAVNRQTLCDHRASNEKKKERRSQRCGCRRLKRRRH
jgi:hypothetical protein